MTILHASGAITNYGTSSVGTGAILSDDSDATYVDNPIGGGNGFVVGLDVLPSIPPDDTAITLHFRASATGGWLEGAASEIWLTADAAGDVPYVGFWDGVSDVTVGFPAVGVPIADGSIQDISCLLTDAALATWGTTRAGVLAQLSVGSYLFVLDSYREGTATASPARVYEAWIEVANPQGPAPCRLYPRARGGIATGRFWPPDRVTR